VTPRDAVILAAGLGTRLRAVVDDRPKGLIEIDGQSLIGRSVAQLRTAGVTQITIVTGYGAAAYSAFAAGADNIRLVHNAWFADTGSMASLATALEATPGVDLLVLESDIVYESRALAALSACDGNATLISGPTDAGDEVWVSSPGGRLQSMSKRRTALASVEGEFVGISRLSAAAATAMLHIFHQFVSVHGHGRMDYETGGLVALSASHPVSTLLLADLLCWGEIDDERQYERVVERVWRLVK